MAPASYCYTLFQALPNSAATATAAVPAAANAAVAAVAAVAATAAAAPAAAAAATVDAAAAAAAAAGHCCSRQSYSLAIYVEPKKFRPYWLPCRWCGW